MARLNVSKRHTLRTHEGAPAKHINKEMQLRRSVMACLLWEKQFYEDGIEIADRITSLIPEVSPQVVANIAVEARENMKLRHVPLLIAREMARTGTLKARTLSRIIQRPDELTEFLAIYWKDGRMPLSAQAKKGLAGAFVKFDAYQLAKYDRDGSVKLRDVLFLCHAKPKDKEQEEIWKKLIDGTLAPPDTWEVGLSAGEDKKQTWERLLRENKLGAMALLRNLRNFERDGVNETLIFNAISKMKAQRVLPFRFIAAAKYAPQWEDKLEPLMLRCLESQEKLTGNTILLVDKSGSMSERLSRKSEMTRYDAACGLAILVREIQGSGRIFTFNSGIEVVPTRRGFALRDAMGQPWNGTYLGEAVRELNTRFDYDRLIVITDEQTHDSVPDPKGKGYMINVASYKNGIGYGTWTHIDGWSEAVIDYIRKSED
jgi:60 kDa SS-A/Ro ribonucleoprotein